MDLTLDPDHEDFRVEARAWLAAHLPATPLASATTSGGLAAHRAWEATLFAAGWSVVNWPTEFGGRDVGVRERLIFEEEYCRGHAPTRVSEPGISLLAPAIFEYGTTVQRARFLRPLASGEEIWCQAWAEPDRRSELGHVSSRATRNPAGDGWLLSGQKTWVSGGRIADWCGAIFPTGPPTEPHAGLTYFLVALDAPGVVVRPVPLLDRQEGFSEISFDGVAVPDAQVLGAVGSGWAVAMSTGGSRRGLGLRSPAPAMQAAAQLVDLFAQQGRPPRSADAVARAHLAAEAYRLHTYQMADQVAQGQGGQVEASCNALLRSEADMAIHGALALLGPEGELFAAGVPAERLHNYLLAVTGTTDAGMNAVHYNIVAEQLLGLPGL